MLIWPGMEVPELKLGHNCGRKRARDDQHHFADNAMCTSAFVSMFAHFMIQKHGPHYSIRARAVSSLQLIISHGAALVGSLSFSHLRFGDNALIAFAITVDLRIRPGTIWTNDFFSEYVSKTWSKYVRDTKVTWIQSENPLASDITLVEFLSFAFDPFLPRLLSDALKPRARALLGIWAHLLDVEVTPKLPPWGDVGDRVYSTDTRTRRGRPEIIGHQQKAAEMLWSHEGENKIVSWHFILSFDWVKC